MQTTQLPLWAMDGLTMGLGTAGQKTSYIHYVGNKSGNQGVFLVGVMSPKHLCCVLNAIFSVCLLLIEG